MKIKTEQIEDDIWMASTKDLDGWFFGYGASETGAIKNLKQEITFARSGGYKPEAEEPSYMEIEKMTRQEVIDELLDTEAYKTSEGRDLLININK